MYTSRPRPAPSKAALRILYQLAYISSGTAVGAGVLCAEERRRRTQIVQRVADNAKKIRQHPRYIANAALAVRADDGYEGEVLRGEGRNDRAQQEPGKNLGGKKAGACDGERVVKGPCLPSMVENGYDATVKGHRRRKRSFKPLEADPERPSTTARFQSRIRKMDAPASSPSGSLDNSRLSRIPLRAPAERSHLSGLERPWSNAQSVEGSVRSKSEPRLAFDVALARGDLARCAELLRAKPKAIASPRMCNDFIRACDRRSEHDILLGTFFRETPLFERINLRSLYNDSRTILAHACSTDVALNERFEELYRSLSDYWRKQVDQRRCHSLLKVTWRSTRNIDVVHDQLHRMKTHLELAGMAPSLRLVDKTMVGIYVSANRTSDALATLARVYHTEPTDVRCILRAAHIYACRRSWNHFHEALRLAEAALPQHGPDAGHLMSASTRTRKHMDDIVQAYSKHHSARQTWKFVTWLQERFGYWPDNLVNRNILLSFVARKAISLIPSWLRILKVAGRPFDMDGETASQLLRQYYEMHRPSHVLVIWFARNLAHFVPSFDPLAFKTLILESISHDLSGVVERNAPWQQEHARQRLARVEDATDHVPSPGHKYRRELYFGHPNAKNADLDAAPRGPTGATSSEKHVAVEVEPGANSSKTTLKPSLAYRMRIQLNLGRPRDVLRMYEESLDRGGIPQGPAALTLAVRASLAESGDDNQAMQMITHAEDVGVNVVSAMEPVLIHRMRNSDPGRTEIGKLRSLVSRYYQASEDSGFIPHHRVGVTAADKLIQSHRPDLALELLCAILRSPYAKDRPVDMVFMTMMIRGQIGRRSPAGVMHWAHESLKMDLRVTPGFLRELKQGLKTLPLPRRRRARLIACIQACKERADEQEYEAKILGKNLVSTISKCMRPEETVDIDARLDLDRAVFGDTMVEPDAATESEADVAEPDKKRLTRRQRMARRREGSSLDESKIVRHSNRLSDIRWARKYRAFLRQPMVLEDGRYVPFRYHMPSQSMKWRGKERAQMEQLKQRREAHWDKGIAE